MSKTSVTCDVLVVGSGAAGMMAALSARRHVRSVLVVEKAPHFGGTSALSGGWVWIPMNAAAIRDGIPDSHERALTYVREETGELFDADRVAAYLENGPRMLDFLERETSVRFVADHTFPDYHPNQPGGLPGGRSLLAKPFDARRLGKHFKNLHPPLRQYTFLGMSIGAGRHITHFLNATRSPKSACIVTGLLLRHAFDRICYGRSPRLYNGGALIGRLAKSLLDAQIELWLSTSCQRLIVEGTRICGAQAICDGATVEIRATRGVILATGGVAQDREMRSAHYPKVQAVSIAPAEICGDGYRIAKQVGAAFRTDVHAVGYSAPFSLYPEADGATTLYPHFIDRGKPGVVLVNSDGERFCNEADSYHDVALSLIAEGIDGAERRAYLIATQEAVRRYGLGAVRPIPFSRLLLREGYIKSAPTIRELAQILGIAPDTLDATIDTFNEHARQGRDPQYGRGSTAYNTSQGDPQHLPNPCLAPLERGPFYAVEVVAGDFGSLVGISVDASARVLDDEARPITGLYAVGNDSVNVFNGAVVGAGVTIGPAMVFGYIAGNAVGRSR